MSPSSPTIDVSVVILFDGPRMLVNRRPEGSYFGGWWEWPGGKREGDESALQCARRELREEIGYDAPGLREYAVREVDYPGRRVRLTFFVGRKPDGAAASPGALEHRWMPPEDVRSLQFLEPNLPVLEQIIAHPPFARI
ncbi:MAG: NUDIX domain-containing protein [Planctomycetes bacterium]|nr:NUDIX domain-containing protein [Planctomycetota bacterium]